MMTHEGNVEEFAETVRRYCTFVEGAASLSVMARLRGARELLAELVQAACRLPDGSADGPDANGDVQIPADWPGFGEFDVYWEIFDPYKDEPSVAGSLSEDLLDVYLDLHRGLLAYDAGEVGAAVWEWKFHFDCHWGDHAVDALRALHRACVRAVDVAG